MVKERYFDLESIPRRILVALEEFGRIERAIYILHNVFQHSPRDIASALNMTERAVQETLQRTSTLAYGPTAAPQPSP